MQVFSILQPAEAPAYRSLAFPRHLPLLLHDLDPSGTTIAVGAARGGVPVGLALAGPIGGTVAAVHAVVVAPGARRRGVGTGLLGALEAAARERGVRHLVGVHRADRPGSHAIERLLASRGFERVRSVVEFVFPVARLNRAPVLDVTCPGAVEVPYTPERLAPLRAFREPSRMDPAALGPDDVDPELATLVALDGRVVACMLGRRAGPATAYVSLLFVHPDLRRRSWLAAFTLKRFLGRLLAHDIARLTCEVALDNAASLAFVDDGLRRYADHRAIVHVVRKGTT